MRSWSLLLVLWSLSCSFINDPAMHMGELEDAREDGSAVPLDDFCDEYARFACAAFTSCCMSEPTPDDCLVTTTANCDSSTRDLIRDARTGYDERAAAGYLAEGRALARTCDIGVLTWARRLVPTVLDGIRDPGATCTPEPLDGGFDYASLLSCQGQEYACIFGGLDRWTCQPRVMEGGGCFLSSDCVTGLYCETPGFGTPGTCAPRLDPGAMCDPEEDACRDVCGCPRGGCSGAMGTCLTVSPEAVYCNVLR